jgi:hypothetical protein
MIDRHRNSLTEHHDKGVTLAESVIAKLRAAKIKDLKTTEDVRQAIENLPDDTLLQVTIADMWLNLSKRQSLARRGTVPPANPFATSDTNAKELVGKKAAIRDWDMAWLEIENLEAGRRVYSASGSQQARAKAAEFTKRIAVLTSATPNTNVIVGFLDAMFAPAFAQALQQPQRLRVALLTWDEILVRAWWNKDDQLLVIDTYLRVLQAWRSEVHERVVLRTD